MSKKQAVKSSVDLNTLCGRASPEKERTRQAIPGSYGSQEVTENRRSRSFKEVQTMTRTDAENVVKALTEKPFICHPTRIETDGGRYAITTKAHLDRLEEMDRKTKKEDKT